jgi:hypothetical protein
MAKSRIEVIDEIVAMIHEDLLRIKVQNVGRQLNKDTAHAVAEYGRTMSALDRNMSAKEKGGADEARTLTDDELEAEIMKAAKAVEGRRGSQPK